MKGQVRGRHQMLGKHRGFTPGWSVKSLRFVNCTKTYFSRLIRLTYKSNRFVTSYVRTKTTVQFLGFTYHDMIKSHLVDSKL